MRASSLLAAVLLCVSPAARAAPPLERLSLEEAVRRALERSPSVEVARAEVERSQALLSQARSGSLPTLGANGLYTRLDHDRSRGDPPQIVQSKSTISGNLQLAVPLVAPQRWVQWSHASENVEAARLAVSDVRRQVAVATARAFVAVQTQQRQVELDAAARETARQHLGFAQGRLRAGVGNRLDELRAAQEVATVETQGAAAQTALVRAREALAILIGADGPVDAADASDPLAAAALPQAPQAALSGAGERADVRTQRARAEAARRQETDSWTDYLPLLSAIFQPFAQSPASLTQPETGWQAQLVLSLPLFDFGARSGSRAERAALAAEARSQVEATLRQARSEVRVAFEAVQRADEGLRAAREASRLARDAQELAAQAYRAGAANELEVVDAQRRARDADTAALSAHDTARQARIDLLAASGRFP